MAKKVKISQVDGLSSKLLNWNLLDNTTNEYRDASWSGWTHYPTGTTYIPAKAGDVITISAYVKVDSESDRNVTCRLFAYNEAGALFSEGSSANTIMAGEEGFIKLTRTLPEGTVSVRFVFRASASGGQNVKASYKEIKAEYGNVATMWFPSINDMRANWTQSIESALSYIRNKPTAFPPSSHSHVLSEITGLVDALAGKVSTAQLVEQLANYIPINGVSTINGTKTFTEAPIVPAGTLNGHAVNLGQLIEQLNGLIRTWHEVLNAGSGSDAVVNRGVTITNTSTTANQDIFSVFHYPNESYDRFFRIQNVGGRLGFYTSQNQENGTGVDIAFFGYYALHALKRDVLNTAIAFNSAFGTNALRELEQGVGNSAFGNNAGRYVRLGDNNTFFGRSAGYSLNLNRLTGSNNTFIGARAGYGVGASSSGNTIIGVNTSTSTEIHNEVIICYGNGQVAFKKHNDGRVVIPTQTKETYVADSTGKAVVTKEILNSYIDIDLNHYQLIEMATSGWEVKQEEFGINTSTHFVRIVPYKCEGTFISPNENAILRSVYLMKDNNKIVGWNWMTPDKYNSRRISSDYGAAQVSSEDPSGYEVSGNFKIACHTYSGGDSKTTFKMRIYYEIVDL